MKKEGIDLEFGTFEAPLTPKIEKKYHVYKFPKVIVFLNENRHPLEAPPYPK